jgi:thiamine phosphate synthase YjbQ (UPF0047 family)
VPAVSPYVERIDNNGDAHLQRNLTRRAARDGPRRAAVITVTKGRLDFGSWERICYSRAEWLDRES